MDGEDICGTSETVGIRCSDGCEGDLWLVGERDNGRLNIYHSGSWGTICHKSFGSQDALVICKQLKMRTTDVQFYTAASGNGTIWLDNVACNGQENRLDYCNHRKWNAHDCGHDTDVGVRCYGGYGSVEGDLRLVGGNNMKKDASRFNTVPNGEQYVMITSIIQMLLWLVDNLVTVNGNWGYWSSWSSYNAVCGSGTKKRTRQCDNPFPAFGGSICTGDSKELQKCAGSFCRVNENWGSWSSWTMCSSSCDSGFQTRNRLCNNPVPSSSGSYCNGKSFEVLNCSIAMCKVDGSWGTWCIWSVCNATCGGGVQKRTRYCNNPYPSAGGSTCSGMAEETLLCFDINCQVNEDWSEWEVWRLCSSSCGSGNRKRTRLCDNPLPSSGGRFCNGNTLDSISCNTQECPVDGDWSGWSSWNICNATCDGGIQDRTRKCDAPQPSNGGHYCNGRTIESRPCNNFNCESNFMFHLRNRLLIPIQFDRQWGTWQEWETCNTTCGKGFQQQIRKCDSPSPYFGRSECMGLDFDIQTCYQDICPVTRNRNGSNTESLAELRVTSQHNNYDCVRRACGIQSSVYDTCNTESNVYVNTQITAENIGTGAHAYIPCNADNVQDV
ncbi:Thrombospondin-1,Mucin-like protein,Hemicentin-1,Thrombospondin-2,A disintegrin and metalloproteinase with thrombospondin motifs adt-1 [Mytilus coruscus]|uniref:Thrombospondin-1,Mucin-like protein,Hemicentin-1,Thrombospondin-2,A disintegrin and metalloproteinase with thrombospondin motifs adt-1 n=1 Tax=Mytilus coruscus TaxID=42192 RepID=A0A6J8ER13_MYTCO|nr:Thrombospondin-1,Mucin-like protein,Hemicentin-1,Thrombospondin-2,A disintegrin and metalloproteinase with thrombospondin motifs adt-1 [Mytilus coruscus]